MRKRPREALTWGIGSFSDGGEPNKFRHCWRAVGKEAGGFLLS